MKKRNNGAMSALAPQQKLAFDTPAGAKGPGADNPPPGFIVRSTPGPRGPIETVVLRT